jgi:glycosyltransferase involved in cell wall biosynthesis
MPPAVSIVLPTYNRARFLPEAFSCIAAQTFSDWDLIVVDDGSTDDTRAMVGAFAPPGGQDVRYVYQENRGAYGARNTGLDHATGDYVAFFDSDDIWLPHHLERCVAALEGHPDLDWVYAACESMDVASGMVVEPTTFEVHKRPRAFRSLATRRAGDLRIIDDVQVLTCQLTHGLFAGLQNSVIRRTVFEGQRFWDDYRVVEDVLFLVRWLARGGTIGYFEDVHVIYRIHGGNSSASVTGASARRLLPVFDEQVRGYERIRREVALPPDAARALRRRLADVGFWHLGYAGRWQTGAVGPAFAAFHAALREWPWSLAMWKTYVACRLKTLVGRVPHETG